MNDSNTSSTRRCYLRQTRVKLLDGAEYTFRALPYTRRVVELLEQADSPRAQLDLIEISLGFDLSAEAVQALLDSGAIPLSPGEDGSDESRIHDEIMAAMIHQTRKPRAGGS